MVCGTYSYPERSWGGVEVGFLTIWVSFRHDFFANLTFLFTHGSGNTSLLPILFGKVSLEDNATSFDSC